LNTDYVFKKLILSYELMKNHAYTDRLIKEGEVKGYSNIRKSYISNNADEYLVALLETKILKAREELSILKAKEEILNEMNKNLEEILSTMDIQEILSNKNKFPEDVKSRIETGKCALKRPGKGGFVCDNEVITGTKYCKEHLKKYEKLTYADLFPGDDNE